MMKWDANVAGSSGLLGGVWRNRRIRLANSGKYAVTLAWLMDRILQPSIRYWMRRGLRGRGALPTTRLKAERAPNTPSSINRSSDTCSMGVETVVTMVEKSPNTGLNHFPESAVYVLNAVYTHSRSTPTPEEM